MFDIRIQTEGVEEGELFYEIYNKRTGMGVSGYFRTMESACSELECMLCELECPLCELECPLCEHEE